MIVCTISETQKFFIKFYKHKYFKHKIMQYYSQEFIFSWPTTFPSTSFTFSSILSNTSLTSKFISSIFWSESFTMISVEFILSLQVSLSLRLESSDKSSYFKRRGSSTLSSSFISSLIYSTLIDSPQSTKFYERRRFRNSFYVCVSFIVKHIFFFIHIILINRERIINIFFFIYFCFISI